MKSNARCNAFIVPDLVLLVNGILLVVIECNGPSVPEPLAEADGAILDVAVGRYLNAFIAARDEWVAEVAALGPEDKGLDDEALGRRPCRRAPRPGACASSWRLRRSSW